MRWIDNSTVEILGEAMSSHDEGTGAVDLTIGASAVVRFDREGKAGIVKAEEVPAAD